MPAATHLQIGEVAALTGISAGRIRHYEARGLIAPDHRHSGYRTFSANDVLRLLHIDLLRSLGMGLPEIRASVEGRPSGLREALRWHEKTLLEQRQRLDVLIAALGEALAEPASIPEDIVERLARAQRHTLGLFGRLERPLSSKAAEQYDRLLSEWELPAPGLFNQMVLPEPISELLERLAETPGHEVLFERLRGLAEQVLHVVITGDERAADELGIAWVSEQTAAALPEPVAAVLRDFAPRLVALPIIRRGFMVWAESMSPLAARVLSAIATEAQRRGVAVIGAIIVPNNLT